MFETLTGRLGDVLGRLTKRGALSEGDVNEALREVRLALLEADVALPVVKRFIDEVRAKAIGTAPAETVPVFAAPRGKSVRGVVQWFDNRAGHGTLRLPGLSHDIPVDAATLSASGISRLFKGQEIDAELDGAGDPPKIAALHLANAAGTSRVSGGFVRDRRAKPVVVELKRETHRRVAARAEAELALAPRRAR